MKNLNIEKIAKLVNDYNPNFAKNLRKKMKNKVHYTYCTYPGIRESIMAELLKGFPKRIEYRDGVDTYIIDFLGYEGHSNTLRFGITKKVPFWSNAQTNYFSISNIKKFLIKMKYPRI